MDEENAENTLFLAFIGSLALILIGFLVAVWVDIILGIKIGLTAVGFAIASAFGIDVVSESAGYQ